MADIVEGLRRELVDIGMKPYWFGRKGTKLIEFISYPWQAGQELFVFVRQPNKPTTVECVGADEVEVLGVTEEAASQN